MPIRGGFVFLVCSGVLVEDSVDENGEDTMEDEKFLVLGMAHFNKRFYNYFAMRLDNCWLKPT